MELDNMLAEQPINCPFLNNEELTAIFPVQGEDT